METRDAIVEYLTSTRVGGKGQLTVPKQFRETLGLGSGASFAVLRLGDGLILLPEQKHFKQLCNKVSAALTGADITPAKVLSTLPDARQRVHERLYGEEVSAKPDRHRRSR